LSEGKPDKSPWGKMVSVDFLGAQAPINQLTQFSLLRQETSRNARASTADPFQRFAISPALASAGRTSNCASLDIIRSGDVIRQNNDRRVVRCAFHGLSNRGKPFTAAQANGTSGFRGSQRISSTLDFLDHPLLDGSSPTALEGHAAFKFQEKYWTILIGGWKAPGFRSGSVPTTGNGCDSTSTFAINTVTRRARGRAWALFSRNLRRRISPPLNSSKLRRP
jgi:hypothetical protein